MCVSVCVCVSVSVCVCECVCVCVCVCMRNNSTRESLKWLTFIRRASTGKDEVET